jgi:hypothetical protein
MIVVMMWPITVFLDGTLDIAQCPNFLRPHWLLSFIKWQEETWSSSPSVPSLVGLTSGPNCVGLCTLSCHVLKKTGLISGTLWFDKLEWYIGFEVLTAVVMKSTIFWDITVIRWVSTDVSEEHIASIFRVEKISWARNQRESNPLSVNRRFLSSLFFRH